MTGNTAKLSAKTDPEVRKLQSLLGNTATVMDHRTAQQPILPPAIRAAVHQWMTEIRAIEDLKALNVEPRRSCLLSGPPGCGKTTLAHHLSARLGVPLICIHMDRLRSQYVGQTGQQIAKMFEGIAHLEANALLFFDEFDSLAAKRKDDGQSASEERNSIVNALLARLESFEGNMIAATNRAAALDPAIWRRFGLQLDIPLPGIEERFAIIKYYLDPLDWDDDAIDFLTAATDGAAPSLLRQMIEGIKRDIVLAGRMNMEGDIVTTFTRVISGIAPHPDYTPPILWEDKSVIKEMKSLPWPPKTKGDA